MRTLETFAMQGSPHPLPSTNALDSPMPARRPGTAQTVQVVRTPSGRLSVTRMPTARSLGPTPAPPPPIFTSRPASATSLPSSSGQQRPASGIRLTQPAPLKPLIVTLDGPPAPLIPSHRSACAEGHGSHRHGTSQRLSRAGLDLLQERLAAMAGLFVDAMGTSYFRVRREAIEDMWRQETLWQQSQPKAKPPMPRVGAFGKSLQLTPLGTPDRQGRLSRGKGAQATDGFEDPLRSDALDAAAKAAALEAAVKDALSQDFQLTSLSRQLEAVHEAVQKINACAEMPPQWRDAMAGGAADKMMENATVVAGIGVAGSSAHWERTDVDRIPDAPFTVSDWADVEMNDRLSYVLRATRRRHLWRNHLTQVVRGCIGQSASGDSAAAPLPPPLEGTKNKAVIPVTKGPAATRRGRKTAIVLPVKEEGVDKQLTRPLPHRTLFELLPPQLVPPTTPAPKVVSPLLLPLRELVSGADDADLSGYFSPEVVDRITHAGSVAPHRPDSAGADSDLGPTAPTPSMISVVRDVLAEVRRLRLLLSAKQQRTLPEVLRQTALLEYGGRRQKALLLQELLGYKPSEADLQLGGVKRNQLIRRSTRVFDPDRRTSAPDTDDEAPRVLRPAGHSVGTQTTLDEELMLYKQHRLAAMVDRDMALRDLVRAVNVAIANLVDFWRGMEVDVSCPRCLRSLADVPLPARLPQTRAEKLRVAAQTEAAEAQMSLLAPCGISVCALCLEELDDPHAAVAASPVRPLEPILGPANGTAEDLAQRSRRDVRSNLEFFKNIGLPTDGFEDATGSRFIALGPRSYCGCLHHDGSVNSDRMTEIRKIYARHHRGYDTSGGDSAAPRDVALTQLLRETEEILVRWASLPPPPQTAPQRAPRPSSPSTRPLSSTEGPTDTPTNPYAHYVRPPSSSSVLNTILGHGHAMPSQHSPERQDSPSTATAATRVPAATDLTHLRFALRSVEIGLGIDASVPYDAPPSAPHRPRAAKAKEGPPSMRHRRRVCDPDVENVSDHSHRHVRHRRPTAQKSPLPTSTTPNPPSTAGVRFTSTADADRAVTAQLLRDPHKRQVAKEVLEALLATQARSQRVRQRPLTLEDLNALTRVAFTSEADVVQADIRILRA